MDYEKKYKEALERAKKLYEQGTITESLNYVFPELKESEDEKIRKEILNVSKQLDENTTICGRNYDYAKWIAWLEKQVETYTKKDVDDAYLKGICDAKRELEKQGEQKPVLPDFKEQEGVAGRDYIPIEWVEVIENYGKWKIIRINEPTLVDKPEPKFKVGDWIAGYYTNFKVLSVNNDGYLVEDVDGNKINILFENEKFHHLWTIQDAKNGDVLSTDSGRPFIFKGLLDMYHPEFPVAYCGVTPDNYFDNNSDENNEWWTNENVYPATKEQRDILFQKMKEAGYEWDADKKELKKVDQK